jgi:hypothetical protein
MSNITSSSRTAGATSAAIPPAARGCCGGPAPKNSEACCVLDYQSKAAGGTGCACHATEVDSPAPVRPRSGCC